MFAGGRKHTVEVAASLHKHQTPAEKILWEYLQRKPMDHKCRRQHVYAIWILDFYCHTLKLAIEVDGSIRNLKDIKNTDERRQKEIEMPGLTFFRFTNNDVEYRLGEVKQKIENFILQNSNKLLKPLQPKSLRQMAEDRGTPHESLS